MHPHTGQITEQALLENRDFLRALARGLLRDEHAADDVVQQAYLAALERPPRAGSYLKSWLVSVVRNLAFNCLKREGERAGREDLAARDLSEDTEERDLEQQQLVLESVRALRQPYRTTIHLRYFRDLSPSEIAVAQDTSIATVKTRLRRGLEILRAELDRRHGGSRAEWSSALAPLAGFAKTAPPTASLCTGGVLKGLILMKKTVLVVFPAVVLAALAWFAWSTADTTDISGVATESASLAGSTGDNSASIAASDSLIANDASAVQAGAAREQLPQAEPMGPETRTIVGRVTDNNGAPVPDADLVLLTNRMKWKWVMLDAFATDHEVETHTDAEGRFVLPATKSGSQLLVVGADGFAPHGKQVKIDAVGITDVGDISLDPGVSLTGHVVDESGHAVVGAKVKRPLRTSQGEFLAVTHDDPSPVVAVTDGAGRFAIPRMAVGPWKLRVSAKGYLSSEADGQIGRAGQLVTGLVVTIRQGQSISGQVVGMPLGRSASLSVRAHLLEPGGDKALVRNGVSLTGSSSTRIKADGRFELFGLDSARSYRLVLLDDSGRSRGARRYGKVEARPGDAGVTLVYADTMSLTFQVVDDSTGLALTDFEVETGPVWMMPHKEVGEVKQRYEEGLVQIDNPTTASSKTGARSVRVRVTATGFAPNDRKGIIMQDEGETDIGVLRMRSVPVARVLVLDDASGKALKGAAVTLVRDTSGEEPPRTSAIVNDGEVFIFTEGQVMPTGVTDENGLCILNSLPGQKAVVTVEAEGYAAYSSRVIDCPRRSDFGHQARLARGTTVTVLVVDSEQVPVSNMTVVHEAVSGLPWKTDASDREKEYSSDAEGRITLDHLENGSHRFRLVESAFDEGAGDAADNWQELKLPQPESAHLTLVAAPRGDLTGVITEAGLPLSGAIVRLIPDASNSRGDNELHGLLGTGPTAKTTSNGHYQIENLMAGPYRLDITHDSRCMPTQIPITVRAGRNKGPVDLSVSSIAGRVIDSSGSPVAGALVKAERPEDGDGKSEMIVFIGSGADRVVSTGEKKSETRTGTDGRYVLRGVAVDRSLVVRVSGTGFAEASSAKLVVGESQTLHDIDFRMSVK